MKTYGGYFGWEFPSPKSEYHTSAIHLNYGRNALELGLIPLRVNKLYLPSYICNAVLEPLYKLNIEPVFYQIDEKLDPLLPTSINTDDALLLVNYFGLKGYTLSRIANAFHGQIVIDNTQAFFELPDKNATVFYSARKFFGVPDGAYLYSDKVNSTNLALDTTFDRCEHLLVSTECGSRAGFKSFQENENAIHTIPARRMSKLAESILASLDYVSIANRRRENYSLLCLAFDNINRLRLDLIDSAVPLCYPLLAKNGKSTKKALINEGVFVPTYWAEIIDRSLAGSFELDLLDDLICLPIDQRYTKDDIKALISLVRKHVN